MPVDPSMYESARVRCRARVQKMLTEALSLANDPFYELSEGGASPDVARISGALLYVRERLDAAALQTDLAFQESHRGSRA